MKVAHLAGALALGTTMGGLLLGVPSTGWSQDRIFLPDATLTVTGGVTLQCADIVASERENIPACWQEVQVASAPEAPVESTQEEEEVVADADDETEESPEHWRHFVSEAADRFAIPETWIYAVMNAESRGRTRLNGRRITSSAGAQGLMQVMPATYNWLRGEHGLGADPHDPRDNILAGTAFLREMYDRFGYPGLFAAYNAGPARYEEHLRTGRPLPPETVTYLTTLLNGDGVSASDIGPIARATESPAERDRPTL